MRPHLEEFELEAFARRRDNQPANSKEQEHVQTCPVCASRLDFLLSLYKGLDEGTGLAVHPLVPHLASDSRNPRGISLTHFSPFQGSVQTREPIELLAARSMAEGPPRSRTVATFASQLHGILVRIVDDPLDKAQKFHVLCRNPDHGKHMLLNIGQMTTHTISSPPTIMRSR
jgi:hypothetical protein